MAPVVVLTTHKLQAICDARKGFGLDKGPPNLKYTYTDPNGARKTIILQCMHDYVYDPNDKKYFKLFKRKRGNLVPCLPVDDPRAYEILYDEGKNGFCEKGHGYNKQKIAAYLNTKFECPIARMIANVNWRMEDYAKKPGIFNLMAYLYGAPSSVLGVGTFIQHDDAAELRKKLQELTDELVDIKDTVVADVLQEVEALKGRVEFVETRLEEVNDRVTQEQDELRAELESKMETVQQELKQQQQQQRDELEQQQQQRYDELRAELEAKLLTMQQELDALKRQKQPPIPVPEALPEDVEENENDQDNGNDGQQPVPVPAPDESLPEDVEEKENDQDNGDDLQQPIPKLHRLPEDAKEEDDDTPLLPYFRIPMSTYPPHTRSRLALA